MPWKFLFFLFGLALVIVFAGLNVQHSADISLGFHTFADVPVFMSLGSAYLLGALTILPFTLSKALKKRKKLSTKHKEERKKIADKKSKSDNSRKADAAPQTAWNETNASNSTGATQKKSRGFFGRSAKKDSGDSATNTDPPPRSPGL